MRPVLGKTLLALLLAAAPAAAQLTGYAVPGSLAEKRLSAREMVMQAYQDARWRIGFLQLEPRLAITDLGYVSNLYSTVEEEAESDFKVQGAAGLRGFFNLGPDVLVSPFVDLGYTWWQDQVDLRSSDGSYGVQLFGNFNRLQIQLQGGRVETQRNISSELEVPVDVQTDRIRADLDIDFFGPFSFFATAAEGRARQTGEAAEARIPQLDLSLLDVDTELVNAGLAYELGNGLSVGVGYEETESVFPNDPDGRSSTGSGPLVRVTLAGSRASLDLQVTQHDLEFAAREGASAREQLVGFGRLGWEFTEKLSGSLFSATRLEVSALDSAAIFEGRRSGFSLARQSRGGTRISAFYEAGEDEFATVTSDEVTRIDDITSYGANIQFRGPARVTLELGFVDSRRESSDPEFDRDLRSLVGRVRLGSDLLPW